MILFLLPVLFLTAEGQNRGWFTDRGVITAVVVLLVIAGLYAVYAKYAERPLIDLKVFTYRNVAIGTLLYFLTGAMNGTGSIITGFMGGILGFDDLYMARTHLFIFIGLAVSVPVCTWMLYRRLHISLVVISGFFAFALYHLLMYFRFYPGIAPKDFMWPLVIKGIGIGFLYVVSSLYISEGVPKQLSTSRMMSGVIARIVFATLLGASVLTTVVSRLTVMHTTGISQQITAGNKAAEEKHENARSYYLSQGLKAAEADKMADNLLRYDVQKPAALLAYKDVYLVMAAGSLIPALLIVFFRLGRRPLRKVEVEPIPL